MSVFDWFRSKPSVLCTECGRPLKYGRRQDEGGPLARHRMGKMWHHPVSRLS